MSADTDSVRLAVAFLGGTLSALFSYSPLSFGYVVKPVEKACPSWSGSITTIGFASQFVAYALLSPFVSYRIERGNLRAWTVVQLLLFSLGFLVAGLSVSACELHALVTQISYALAFFVVACGTIVATFVVTFILLRAGRRSGLASSYWGFVSGVGILLLNQIILFEQKYVNAGKMHISTLFFSIGLISVLPMAISLPCIVVSRKVPSSTASAPPTASMTRLEIIKTWQFYVFVIVRTSTILPAYGLLARQQDFLEAVWKGTSGNVIQTLALIASLAYLIGRFTWLMSDFLTIKGAWILSLTLQAISLAFSPFLIQSSASYAPYLGMLAFCIVNFGFPVGKSLTSAMCSFIYGPNNMGLVWGLQLMFTFIPGVGGSLIMEKLYQASGGHFTVYLYVCAGISTVAFLLCLTLKPVTTVQDKKEEDKNEQSRLLDSSVKQRPWFGHPGGTE